LYLTSYSAVLLPLKEKPPEQKNPKKYMHREKHSWLWFQGREYTHTFSGREAACAGES